MTKLIKTLFWSLLFFTFSLVINNQQVFALEYINSFYSRIEINQDTSLSITEQIDYNTTISKHGIYRYIPITYNKNGVKETLPISNIKVSDDRGNSIPFSKSSDGKFINLKIGDPDKTFSGQKIYVISYEVERGVFAYDDHNELNWDITGEGWQFPINQSSATVISRYSPIDSVDCFSGIVGGDDGLCNYEQGENQVTFTYLKPINYGSNMTVVLNLPKQSELVFPTQRDLFILWLKNNWMIFLIPLPLIFMITWWFKNGRDIEFVSANVFDMDTTKPTKYSNSFFTARKPMVYEPLKDLTPGEAGAIIDGRTDIQDIVAEILELARKKYLKIEVEEKKVFFSKSREYIFTKQVKGQETLTSAQQTLLDAIFKSGDTVKLSQLKGKFYQSLPAIKTKIQKSLMEKKVYTSNPISIIALGCVFVAIATGILLFLYINFLAVIGIIWPIPIIIFQAFIGIFFAIKLPQKTAIGTNLWLQARGLRESIKRGTWRQKINEKHLFIEEVLPFAVSLGVVKQLSKDMKELNLEPPKYISGNMASAMIMSDFVNNFNNDVSTGLSYNPNSSSASGGGSGGGGGGGGGGSW